MDNMKRWFIRHFKEDLSWTGALIPLVLWAGIVNNWVGAW